VSTAVQSTLGRLEFDLPCGWEDHPCDRDAAVMCKGCADEDGRALCIDHYFELQGWFDEQMPATCEVCYRPFMHFDTHYSTINL
jgi:hypothetical protein